MTIEKFCPIDNEPLEEKKSFCINHQRALNSLITTYDAWDTAYDGLSWEEYLEKLIPIRETVGKWVNEIVDYLIEKKLSYDKLKKMVES